jgi:signal transduction histidine kinase
LENAIKYSKDVTNVNVHIKQNNKHLSVEIADQGIGIPDKEKKYVFEKFYRVGSEDTRTTKGTGLGLFIVKQIMKAHKGNIHILDNQPKGTIMRLCFPLGEVKR